MDKRIQSLSQFFHFPLKHGDSVESLMLLSAVNSAHRAPQVQSCVCMTRPEDRKAASLTATQFSSLTQKNGGGPGTASQVLFKMVSF